MIDTSLANQFTDILKLLLAGVMGAVLGYEREHEGKPAHINDLALVCGGSCLFAVVGLAFGGADSASRIASTIATGIGFLGAGVIIQDEDHVHGVTTAASIWVAAAIGLAVGIGLFVVAGVATLGVYLLLRFVSSSDGHTSDDQSSVS